MLAQYTSSPLYLGNPYIEALPPMMVGRELASALAFLPPYSPPDRERPAGERLQLLSQLYSIYQPLPMTIELYCQIYNTMLHSYSTYTPITEAVYAHAAYASIRSGANAASIGGGSSFSLIGVSGLGKSTALQRVLSLFPQDIEHKSYQGKMLCCHQIPYLVVQTPHDASVKALILDIYLQIDALLGTTYHVHAEKTRATTDVLVSQLSLILRSNHVGLLVVDELQNVAYRKGNGGSKFLNFLVQLINSAGIGVCMVGTPRVFQLLQQEFRSARRATGLVYDRLPDGAEFDLLLRTLWHYQYTQNDTTLTPELRSYLYRWTQGIPDILVKLMYHAQEQAILTGIESLNAEQLKGALQNNLGMVNDYLSELDHTPSPNTYTPAHSKVQKEASPSTAQTSTGQDFVRALKIAKRQGLSPLSVYSNYIKGEVSI